MQHVAVLVAGRVHAITDGEVAADEVSPHGCVFAGEDFVLIGGVGMIFAVVDANDAFDAGSGIVRLVHGLWPLSTLAKTWKAIHQHLCNEKIGTPCICYASSLAARGKIYRCDRARWSFAGIRGPIVT